ncbi:hypothetical protein AB0H71_02930 [Nocardia sp. NPDC050697]|uniref:hypothetical protein n=1 Tax=Nocardia sp. NPDC050697 TaxID=3155158 RepID=UPI0033FB2A31
MNADTAERTAEKLLRTAPPDYDCVTGNVAALLALHDIDPDRLLGGYFCAAPASGPGGELSFAGIGAGQLERATAAGAVRIHAGEGPGPDTAAALVAIGDAYAMPWTPYAGQKHIEHGFLVLGTDLAFDPYRTITEFGAAVPTVITEPDRRAATITRHLKVEVIDPGACAAEPVSHTDPDATAEYRERLRGGTLTLDQLALDTWLLARARRVNDRYRPGLLAESIEAWTRASEVVYLALRRAKRGRSVPATYIDAVAAALDVDADVAGRW